MMSSLKNLLNLFVVSSLAACAPMITSTPTTLVSLKPSSEVQRVFQMEPAEVTLSTGYKRTLAAKSQWRLMGSLPQGLVYKSVDSVFTIEGRQMHEAYLVVKDQTLQGFYLVGEERYSPLSQTIQLALKDSP